MLPRWQVSSNPGSVIPKITRIQALWGRLICLVDGSRNRYEYPIWERLSAVELRSVLMVGLRGVGKTVSLDMRDDAERAGIQTLRMEAPEGRSLPALLAPQLRLSSHHRSPGCEDATPETRASGVVHRRATIRC
jgi:hypothetical protein